MGIKENNDINYIDKDAIDWLPQFEEHWFGMTLSCSIQLGIKGNNASNYME